MIKREACNSRPLSKAHGLDTICTMHRAAGAGAGHVVHASRGSNIGINQGRKGIHPHEKATWHKEIYFDRHPTYMTRVHVAALDSTSSGA